VNRKNTYLFLCVLGFVIPYSQFVPWVMENGLQLGLFLPQPASAPSSVWMFSFRQLCY
jgi:Terpene cyclase DEP1